MRSSNAWIFVASWIVILSAVWVTTHDVAPVEAQAIPGAYSTVEDEGAPLAKRRTLNFEGVGVTCADASPVTTCTVPGVAAQQHSITFVIDGGGAAIVPGDLNVYPVAAFGCEINRWDISADQVGDIEVEIWKDNAAIPTAANVISGANPPELAADQLNQALLLVGWTTTVSNNDVFGGTVVSATDVERVTVQLWCE